MKKLINLLAWKIFLWSSGMTYSEYTRAVYCAVRSDLEYGSGWITLGFGADTFRTYRLNPQLRVALDEGEVVCIEFCHPNAGELFHAYYRG